MGKIIIHADDLHRFGGIDLLLDKKSKNSISQSHLILAGNFDSHCMKILSEYLERNNLKVKSITYSADIDTIPAVCSFDFTDTIIIPQGVRIISDYSFCNC